MNKPPSPAPATDGLTDAELAELERLEDAVTKGRWTAKLRDLRDDELEYRIMAGLSGMVEIAELNNMNVGSDELEANAKFITLARHAFPRLLAEVRRLRVSPAFGAGDAGAAEAAAASIADEWCGGFALNLHDELKSIVLRHIRPLIVPPGDAGAIRALEARVAELSRMYNVATGDVATLQSILGADDVNAELYRRQRNQAGTLRAWQADNERLRTTLEQIAEGNLGPEPWQANYDRIRDVARSALSGAPPAPPRPEPDPAEGERTVKP